MDETFVPKLGLLNLEYNELLIIIDKCGYRRCNCVATLVAEHCTKVGSILGSLLWYFM
jgi:hypothetical protein